MFLIINYKMQEYLKLGIKILHLTTEVYKRFYSPKYHVIFIEVTDI